MLSTDINKVFAVTPKDATLLTESVLEKALNDAQRILPTTEMKAMRDNALSSDNPHLKLNSRSDELSVLVAGSKKVKILYDELFMLTSNFKEAGSPLLYSSLAHKHAGYTGSFTTSVINGPKLFDDNTATLMEAIIEELTSLLPGLDVCRVGQVLFIVNHSGVLAYHHPVFDPHDRMSVNRRVLHQLITTEKSFDVVYKHVLAKLNNL